MREAYPCVQLEFWKVLEYQDGSRRKDGAGRMAVAEGKFSKTELTKEQAIEQARHVAEEAGRKFDPSTIKSGTTVYQVAGTGAVILDK